MVEASLVFIGSWEGRAGPASCRAASLPARLRATACVAMSPSCKSKYHKKSSRHVINRHKSDISKETTEKHRAKRRQRVSDQKPNGTKSVPKGQGKRPHEKVRWAQYCTWVFAWMYECMNVCMYVGIQNGERTAWNPKLLSQQFIFSVLQKIDKQNSFKCS